LAEKKRTYCECGAINERWLLWWLWKPLLRGKNSQHVSVHRTTRRQDRSWHWHPRRHEDQY
jgi:hypothetical protein